MKKEKNIFLGPKQTVPLMGPKNPMRQYMGGVLMTSDHAPFSIGSDAVAMVELF